VFGIADDNDDKDKLKLIVGVSSGIYSVARSSELGSVVRKLGFALTRGANAIEIGGDVPHEIDYTQGKELRYIAEKQGVTINLHGSLTVPMGMPERGEWRDAHNHLQKSIRSAVMGGCKYVNFHACLNFWLEMMTYAGRKLTMVFCDHEGNFISKILGGKEGEKLRAWFTEKKYSDYYRSLFNSEEISDLNRAINYKVDQFRTTETTKLLAEAETPVTEQEEVRWVLDHRQPPPRRPEDEKEKIRKTIQKIDGNVRKKSGSIERKIIIDKMKEKLKNGEKWDSEEIRGMVSVIDGYHILAHYLYYKKDPLWIEMAKMYKGVLEKYKTVTFRDPMTNNVEEYSYPDGKYWLDGAWEKAETDNDREFKEFFYAVCAAKYIEGHIKKVLEWMKNEEPDGLLGSIKADVGDDDEEYDRLKKFAKDLKITLEIPDARSPEYAGLYLICRPKHIYAAVKTIRKELDTKALYMLIDFEHIATQGFDTYNEIKEFTKLVPDAGKYILALHVTKPTPLHHHIQVEIGDVDIYKLLWSLVDKSELGKEHDTYLIYERGGDRDPFKQSVTALRLMVEQLQNKTKPDELVGKPEFFGMKGASIGTEQRQRAIISEHTEDPIDGLLVVAEEGHTFIGRAATSKPGVTPDKWKKEELK